MRTAINDHILGASIILVIFGLGWIYAGTKKQIVVPAQLASSDPSTYRVFNADDKVALMKLAFAKAIEPNSRQKWGYSASALCQQDRRKVDLINVEAVELANHWNIQDEYGQSFAVVPVKMIDDEPLVICQERFGKIDERLLLTDSREIFDALEKIGLKPDFRAVESSTIVVESSELVRPRKRPDFQN